MITKSVLRKSKIEQFKTICIFTKIKYRDCFCRPRKDNNWNIMFESEQSIFVTGSTKNLLDVAGNESLIADSIIFSIPKMDLDRRVDLFKVIINKLQLIPKNQCFYTEPSYLWKEIFYKLMDEINLLLGKFDVIELINKVDAIFDFEYVDGEVNDSLRICLYAEFVRICVKYKKYLENDSYLISKYKLIMIAHKSNFCEFKKNFYDFLIYLNELIKLIERKNMFTENLLEYLEHNYMKGINMAVIANEYNLNYAYFSHKFRDCFGEKFSSFLRNYRIEKAKELLENSCYTMSEIAKNTGFKDTKYFFKAFKQITGITPGEYKRKYLI